MQQIRMPSPDQARFDAICAEVEDWETLPALLSPSRGDVSESEHERRAAPLNELILAGLVSPV